jgi:hypothetical protein
MRHSSLRAGLTSILTLALTALGTGAMDRARAADCGTGVGPCHCGDRVVADTRLGSSDPVLRGPCPCDGLGVASGVTLELRGTLAAESDLCFGIRLEDNSSGVVVKNGRITGFGVGVYGDVMGGVSSSRFADLQISGGFLGVLLSGDANVVESTVVRDALVAGLLLLGDDNTARLNRVEGAAIFGLGAVGNGNAIARNLVQRNSGDGIALAGEHALVEGNRSTYNGGAGFVLEGAGHTASGNIAASNALDGFAVGASASTFARNRGDFNRLFGIAETGIDNTYVDNRCTGNDLGPSSPPGLCR